MSTECYYPPYTHLPHLPHRPHHRIQPITWVTSRVKSRAILSPVESEHAKSRLVINAPLGEFSFVHDSLAGFAKDVTLPSDPRCCYIGGDEELKYANNRPVETKPLG